LDKDWFLDHWHDVKKSGGTIKNLAILVKT